MYALKIVNTQMFIRKEHFCTDNKASALLFETAEQAREYVNDWRTRLRVNLRDDVPLVLVEVAVKPVMTKVLQEIEIL